MKSNRPISQDPEVIIEGKLEHLRLRLALHMRSLRERAGLTQTEVAERLGVKQAAVSKLENSTLSHDIESVMRYLHALEAELLVAVKDGEQTHQISDNEADIVVRVPVAVAQVAKRRGKTAQTYVNEAVIKYGEFSYNILPMTFHQPKVELRAS